MRKIKRLAFTCRVCGAKVVPSKTILDGFEMISYDEMVEWTDFTDNLPDLDEQIWQRSEVAPSQGEIKTVKVHSPFNFELEEQFWLLFMPASSYFNGWSEHPEEVDKSALIKCSFENILVTSEACAWIQIKILEVLPLGEISNRFPVIQCNKYLADLKAFSNVDTTDYKDWIEYSWSAQSDLGSWALVHKQDSGKHHMVLYCDWGFHYNNVYCGNMEVHI